MFFKKLFVVISLFFGVQSVYAAGSPSSGQSSGQPDENAVIVDKVEIKGNAVTSIEFIKSTLQIPLGDPLNRTVLDDLLTQGRHRLELMGQYEKVDLRLEKSSEHKHYLVVVELIPRSTHYAGVGIGYRIPSRFDDSDSSSEELRSSVFLGSRDFADTGLMVDLEFGQKMYQGEDYRFSNAYSEKSKYVKLSTLKQEIWGSRFFLGLSQLHQKSDSKSTNYSYAENPEGYKESRYSSELDETDLDFGYKLGFWTFDLNLGVGWTPRDIKYETIKFTTIYSEKSNLAILEEGGVFKSVLFYSGDHSNKRFLNDYGFYTVKVGGEYTWFIYPHHAVTPLIEIYFSNYGKMSDFEKGRPGGEAALRYDYATTQGWVVGLQGGIEACCHTDSVESIRFVKKASISARKVTPDLILDLDFSIAGNKLQTLNDNYGRGLQQ